MASQIIVVWNLVFGCKPRLEFDKPVAVGHIVNDLEAKNQCRIISFGSVRGISSEWILGDCENTIRL